METLSFTPLYLPGRVSQLSPAWARRCDCCCCCCWRSLTHFFPPPLSSVGTALQTVFADCATRHAIGPTEREKRSSVVVFLAAFCPTRVPGLDAHVGRGPPHRVSCASLWPCGGFSAGAHFSLSARLFHAPKLSRFSHETQHLRRFSTRPLAFSSNFPLLT